MSVYKKIHLVMKDVQYLKKDDHVKFKEVNYKAISEEKVTSTIRASMVEHGLVIIPIKQEHKKDGNLTTVDVTYKIVDIDDGDFVEAVSSGTGADTQDKGVGKAMTYAYKYLLLRTFAIPTGEDPDKICSTELDEKAKAEVKKQEPDKSNILVVLSKWETLSGDKTSFAPWVMSRYQKHIEELTVEEINSIDVTLTKKLTEKKSAS